MADLLQFYNIKTFQWARPSHENPRLSAPISSSVTAITVTDAPNDENGTVVTGDFLMGITNKEGYTESAFVPSGTLSYDTQTANFTVGKILTGGTSAATAYIIADSDSGTTGTLTLAFVSGTFQNNETITDNNSSPGSALVNGTLTNSVSANGLTISNCVRGCDLAGLDPTTQNSAGNAVAHDQDDAVFCQVSAVNFTMMENALKGAIASGGANWKIGRSKDEDITVFAFNGDTNLPYWQYDSATSGWIFSNDGVSSTPFGTGAGVTGGDGITVTAGDIDVDLTDTTVFRTSRNGNEARGVVTAAADGLIALNFLSANINEANTFFGLTDATGTEMETLTDGSDASALHTHGGSSQAGTGTYTGGAGSGNIDIDVTPFDSGDVVKLDLAIYLYAINDGSADSSRASFFQLHGILGGEYSWWSQTNTNVLTTPPIVWAAGVPFPYAGAWAVSCQTPLGGGTYASITLTAPTWSGNNIRIPYTIVVQAAGSASATVSLTATKLA